MLHFEPVPVQCDVSRDAAAFNALANHPDCLPHLSVDGSPVDLAPVFEDEGTIGFLGDRCGFVTHELEPGQSEVHSMALAEVRGATPLITATFAIRHMFIATRCMELVTKVPEGNFAAAALAHKVGFRPEFSRDAAWGDRGVTYYALRYHDWVTRQDWLRASGEWFHEILGDTLTHAHDPAHDLFVGACVEMVKAGMPGKGVILYNRWARFAGYQPIEIESLDPLVIDIVSHRILFDMGSVEIIECR